MKKEDRRLEKRYSCQQQIEVYLTQGVNGPSVTPAFTGRLINISRYGAGIALEEVMADRIHIAYGPMESDSLFLTLALRLDPAGPPLLLPAKPFWFDRKYDDDLPPFRLGILFIESLPAKFIRQITAHIA